jgi:hypothetical protein
MPTINRESPLTIEEILLLWGYVIHYKDADVCVVINPRDKKSRPICINQKVGPHGLSAEIMDQILFEARIDSFQYPILLAKVKARQEELARISTPR